MRANLRNNSKRAVRQKRSKFFMSTIIKFGLAAFAVGAFTTLASKADTPDATFAFTKHSLPVPGAYFQNRENQQPALSIQNGSRCGWHALSLMRHCSL